MSLATRCFSCGTVFRVVEDQLKVSEGWVRCGRCEEVFNALEALFDLDTEAPPPWPGDALPATSVPEESPPPPAVATSPAPFDEPAAQVASSYHAHGAPPSPHDTAPAQGTQAKQAAPLPLVAESAPPLAADDTPVRPPAALPPISIAPALAPIEAAPDFVRQAERDAAWRRPGVRVGMLLLALLFTFALLAQAAVRWRDAFAARWPAAAPVLQALCKLADCRIEALRRVDSLAVDSSGLVKLDGANLYRLSVVLRNRDTARVMLPALDLTLTDAQGQVVARKVLQAADFGVSQTTLGAGAELALQGVLNGGERRLAGYTVEIFYP
jgi:predicted Zn finger-like uncharacterized protein